MVTGGPRMPGPVLYLLLVLPPFLMSKGSFPYSVPGSRDFHRLGMSWGSLHSHLSQDGGTLYHRRSPGAWQQNKGTKNKNPCHSSYDLYFIVDRGAFAPTSPGCDEDKGTFVGSLPSPASDAIMEDECEMNCQQCFLPSPELRISFIIYSSQGRTLMKLTSDRKEIEEGLNRLRSIVPSGATNMHEGLKRANEQIEEVNSSGKKVPSIVIAQTDGTLIAGPFQDAKIQAAKSRNLGATVFGVGVNGYKKQQLEAIADDENHVFAVNGGFDALPDIADALTSKACIEVTSAKASKICLKENYELVISGKGFNNVKNKDEVICRFKFSENKFFDKKATSVEDTAIKCPGMNVEKPDQEVFVEVSLNNGISFSKENISITSKDCVEKQAQPPAAPPPNPQPDSPTESPPELPPDTPPDIPPDTPPAQKPAPSPPSQFTAVINPLYFLALIPALLMFPLLFCCIWCYKRICKETPVQKPEKEPEACYIQTCPTVIVPCCGCQVDGIRRMEGKLDTLCDFVQDCNQVPLVCCQPRDKRRCINFALMKPYLGQLPCSPKTCLGPSQECHPFSNYCSWCHQPLSIFSQPPSRMLPLIPPNARALYPGRTTLSLPPP
ncbi:anthrax toxin receptor-like [Hipposideros larvatus]